MCVCLCRKGFVFNIRGLCVQLFSREFLPVRLPVWQQHKLSIMIIHHQFWYFQPCFWIIWDQKWSWRDFFCSVSLAWYPGKLIYWNIFVVSAHWAAVIFKTKSFCISQVYVFLSRCPFKFFIRPNDAQLFLLSRYRSRFPNIKASSSFWFRALSFSINSLEQHWVSLFLITNDSLKKHYFLEIKTNSRYRE